MCRDGNRRVACSADYTVWTKLLCILQYRLEISQTRSVENIRMRSSWSILVDVDHANVMPQLFHPFYNWNLEHRASEH